MESTVGFRTLLLKYAESVAFTCDDTHSMKLFLGFVDSFVKSNYITKEEAKIYLAEFGLNDTVPHCDYCDKVIKLPIYTVKGCFCSHYCALK